MKKSLNRSLKKILNALAAQYLDDYISDEDKQAALNKVLADIKPEDYPQHFKSSEACSESLPPAVMDKHLKPTAH